MNFVYSGHLSTYQRFAARTSDTLKGGHLGETLSLATGTCHRIRSAVPFDLNFGKSFCRNHNIACLSVLLDVIHTRIRELSEENSDSLCLGHLVQNAVQFLTETYELCILWPPFNVAEVRCANLCYVERWPFR